MEWGDFGITALVSGIISAVIGILVKHRAEFSIVRAQAELEKEAIRHQIRYGSLHEKRFNFLFSFYPKLVALGQVCYDYIHAHETDYKTAVEKLYMHFGEVKDDFEENRVLLPASLDDLISDVLQAHIITAKRIKIAERSYLHEPDDEKAEERAEKLGALLKKLEESLKDVKTKVREEVSRLIGSEEGAGA